MEKTSSLPLSRLNKDHLEKHAKYDASSMLDVTVIVSLDYLMKIKDFFDVDEQDGYFLFEK